MGNQNTISANHAEMFSQLNDIGYTNVAPWSEQRQWKHRFYVHDVVRDWMLKKFKEKNITFDNNNYDLVSFCASNHYRFITSNMSYKETPNIIFKIVDTIARTCFNHSRGNMFFYPNGKAKMFFLCSWNNRFTMTAAEHCFDTEIRILNYIDVARKMFSLNGNIMPKKFKLQFSSGYGIDSDGKEKILKENDQIIFGIRFDKKTLKNRQERVFINYNYNNYDSNLMGLIILLEHEIVHALLEGFLYGEDEKSGNPIGRVNGTYDSTHKKLFCNTTERLFGHKDIKTNINEIVNKTDADIYKSMMLNRDIEKYYSVVSKNATLGTNQAYCSHNNIKLKF